MTTKRKNITSILKLTVIVITSTLSNPVISQTKYGPGGSLAPKTNVGISVPTPLIERANTAQATGNNGIAYYLPMFPPVAGPLTTSLAYEDATALFIDVIGSIGLGAPGPASASPLVPQSLLHLRTQTNSSAGGIMFENTGINQKFSLSVQKPTSGSGGLTPANSFNIVDETNGQNLLQIASYDQNGGFGKTTFSGLVAMNGSLWCNSTLTQCSTSSFPGSGSTPAALIVSPTSTSYFGTIATTGALVLNPPSTAAPYNYAEITAWGVSHATPRSAFLQFAEDLGSTAANNSGKNYGQIGYDSAGIMYVSGGTTYTSANPTGITLNVDNGLNVGKTITVGNSYTTPTKICDNTGCLTSVIINGSSDIRLKKDIHPLTDALDKIAQLNGVRYYWKDPQRGTGEQVGLIAQDVEKVYPQLVSQDKKTGMKAIYYDHLIGPVVEAVKALNLKITGLQEQFSKAVERLAKLELRDQSRDKQIEDLKAQLQSQLSEMKNQNAALKAEVQSLKAQVQNGKRNQRVIADSEGYL